MSGDCNHGAFSGDGTGDERTNGVVAAADCKPLDASAADAPVAPFVPLRQRYDS
jgi:hypothetical protein